MLKAPWLGQEQRWTARFLLLGAAQRELNHSTHLLLFAPGPRPGIGTNC